MKRKYSKEISDKIRDSLYIYLTYFFGGLRGQSPITFYNFNKKSKIIFFVFVLLCCISCGKKEWPKPIKKEDMFSFSKVYAKYKRDCLEIKGEILGNVKNLKQIILEMEISKDVCKRCPFSPDVKITYIPTQNPKKEVLIFYKNRSVPMGLRPLESAKNEKQIKGKQKESLINQRFFKFLSPNSFVLTYCRDTGHNVSRVRLVGVNRFSELGYVYSKIIKDVRNN